MLYLLPGYFPSSTKCQVKLVYRNGTGWLVKLWFLTLLWEDHTTQLQSSSTHTQIHTHQNRTPQPQPNWLPVLGGYHINVSVSQWLSVGDKPHSLPLVLSWICDIHDPNLQVWHVPICQGQLVNSPHPSDTWENSPSFSSFNPHRTTRGPRVAADTGHSIAVNDTTLPLLGGYFGFFPPPTKAK